MFLVLIETSGNQEYIFSTNKLKENIGASELTYRAGTKWIFDAVANVSNTPQLSLWTEEGSQAIREKLLNPTLNPQIDRSQTKVEIIIATSGKALLLVKDKHDAIDIIEKVTTKALVEAPGLDICGVISDEFSWEDTTLNLGHINAQVHLKFEQVRAKRPQPLARFPRLPIAAECTTSGLPASFMEGKQGILRSAVSQSKRLASENGFKRIAAILTQVEGNQSTFLKNMAGFDEELHSESINAEATPVDWISVVHADGNGLGQIFLDFGKYYKNPRDYVDRLREFSIAIDICTESAFLEALQVFSSRDQGLPVVPLILGGDDLTVVCDGRYALQFTAQFLTSFEALTQNPVALPGRQDSSIITDITAQVTSIQKQGLSACAGITVMKKHFPFSIAYGLAEQLIKSAKSVKKIVIDGQAATVPCSAIDFHILYDSSGVELDAIRQQLQLGQTLLSGKPYVVSDLSSLEAALNKTWINHHHWQQLQRRVAVLREQDEENRHLLPNGQMHELRDGLFLGKEAADARYQLIRSRYLKQSITDLEGDPKSLFWQEASPSNADQTRYVTGFLDAIDAAGFWEGAS